MKMKPCGAIPHSGKGMPMKGTNTKKMPLMAKGMKPKLPGQHKGMR